jgi:hypothetical protein
MQTLAKAALGIALVALLATLTHERTVEEKRGKAPEAPQAATGVARPLEPLVPCPPGQLPDGRVCIPVPKAPLDTTQAAGPRSQPKVARLPERPRDMLRYDFGVPLLSGGASEATLPGQTPAPAQAQGFQLRASESTAVHSAALESQQGPTVVRLVDPSGGRIVTSHSVASPSGTQRYAVYYANLKTLGVSAGQKLTQRTPLGTSPSGSSEDPHIDLDLRRLRQGANDDGWRFGDFLDDSKTVRVDPRNLFPLR